MNILSRYYAGKIAEIRHMLEFYRRCQHGCKAVKSSPEAMKLINSKNIDNMCTLEGYMSAKRALNVVEECIAKRKELERKANIDERRNVFRRIAERYQIEKWGFALGFTTAENTAPVSYTGEPCEKAVLQKTDYRSIRFVFPLTDDGILTCARVFNALYEQHVLDDAAAQVIVNKHGEGANRRKAESVVQRKKFSELMKELYGANGKKLGPDIEL